jgi:hypothetical protein
VFLFRYAFLPAFLFISFGLWAQDQPTPRRGSRIIDDSTKQVYGPKTSRYYYEEDVFLNRQKFHLIDTVIRNFHRYTYVQRFNNMYQDLGNIGTAITPIFYQTPMLIGATSGFRSYDMYWDTEQVKYYDTKSPFTNMNVILGGKGRSITRASFSRNINPRWNFGFDYRGLLIDKQVQRQSKGDRNVRSTYYDLYTAFQTKDSTYRLFFNLRRNKLEADEYGGIRKGEGFVYKDYFFTNAQPNLLDASSLDLRMNLHLYHQYEVGKALQIYHTFDRYRQGAQFLDVPGNAPDGYYDHVEVDSVDTDDYSKFISVRNEFGIKGNLSKLFYNGYYAIRDYSMSNKYTSPDSIRVSTSGFESYLGGRISLFLDSLGEVTGWGELQQNGNYRLEGKIKSKWFEASLKQMQYDAPLMQQSYRGSHDVWYNDFSPTNVTQLNGYLHYRSRVLQLSPGLTFTRLGNYTYFKYNDEVTPSLGLPPNNGSIYSRSIAPEQTVLPVQTSQDLVIVAPEFKFGLRMARHILFNGQVLYTKVLKNSNGAIQVPELFINTQLAYENIFFDGNLDMHAGFDFHFMSSYYAYGYDVAVQQFYIQQSYLPPAFPLLDVFFNARINRGRIFVKYNNLIQLFTKEGYMPTPEYPGQRNILDFGFDWSFYD